MSTSTTSSVTLLLVAIIATLVVVAPATASPASDDIHQKTQPDGTEFDALQWGDAWYHGWETVDGYTIVQNESTGWWYYATVEGGELVATDLKVGIDQPDGLPKHVRGAEPAAPSAAASGSAHGSCTGQIPSTGDVDIPILMANFTDTTPSFSTQDFQDLLFGTNPSEATGPGSLSDYFEEASNGRLNFGGNVDGWYTSDHDEAHYGRQNSGRTNAEAAELVEESVQAADSDVDFSQYDNNGDGCVSVIVIHEGAGEEESGDVDDIWSHRWSLASAPTTSPVTVDGVTVNSYSLQPETDNIGRLKQIGTIAHETGHLFGLPDLYDTNGGSEGIGEWGLMGSGSFNGVSQAGDSPAHPTAWTKLLLGWGNATAGPDQIQPDPDGQLLPPMADLNVFTQIGNNDGVGDWGTSNGEEYFLVTHRRQVGFDAGLPGEGMLVWHVDETQSNNQDENDKLLDLEAADGATDLDSETNRGDPGDPFPGSSDQTRFTDGTTPNANFKDGSASGINLHDIGIENQAVRFNNPNDRTLNSSAAYAVPVGTSTPAGFVPNQGHMDVRAAWESGKRVQITAIQPPFGSATSSQVANQFDRLSVSTVINGGYKVIYSSSSSDVDFRSTNNYPEYPLPGNLSVSDQNADFQAGNNSKPGQVGFAVTVTTAGQPYTYSPFSPPTADHFNVSVGGKQVDTKNLTVTVVNQDEYRLRFTAPPQPSTGTYDLNVTFTDEKLKVVSSASTSVPDKIKYSKGGAGGSTSIGLIIDASGSMGCFSPPCPIDKAKTAADQFEDLMGPNEYITVVSYDTSAVTQQPITRLGGNRTIINNSIYSITDGGSTNIYSGLFNARSELDAAPSGTSKAAILLSDGFHNAGPSEQEIINLAGTYAARGYCVYTIGLGSSFDDQLLRDIASQNCGDFRTAATASDLSDIYRDLAGTTSGGSTIQQISGVIKAGQVTTKSASLDTTLDSATLSVSTGSSSSAQATSGASSTSVQVRLLYPNGTAVQLNASSPTGTENPDIVYKQTGGTFTYRITEPMPGTWGYKIANLQAQNVSYDARVSGSSRVTLTATTDSSQYLNGSSVSLSATLLGPNGGVSGATVAATITEPNGQQSLVTLTETAPGQYEGSYTPATNGSYQAKISASEGSIQRQEDVSWTVVSKSSLLDVKAVQASDSAHQTEKATVSLNVSRPQSPSPAVTSPADLSRYDSAARELAQSSREEIQTANVPESVKEAALELKDGDTTATARQTAQGASSTIPFIYVKPTTLQGPGNAKIDASAVSVDLPVFQLANGTSEDIVGTVSVPASAKPGVYTGTIKVRTQGLVFEEKISIAVNKATNTTFRQNIRDLVKQWQNVTSKNKLFYEQRIAERLSQVYFGTNATASPVSQQAGVQSAPTFSFTSVPSEDYSIVKNGSELQHSVTVETNASSGPIEFVVYYNASSGFTYSYDASINGSDVNLITNTSTVTVNGQQMTAVRFVHRSPSPGPKTVELSVNLTAPNSATTSPIYTGGTHAPSSTTLTLHSKLVAVTEPPGDLNGNQMGAKDPDNDGVYEDVDGSGTLNIVDVQALFINLNSPAVQGNEAALDMNEDGKLNIIDVQTLFVQLQP